MGVEISWEIMRKERNVTSKQAGRQISRQAGRWAGRQGSKRGHQGKLTSTYFASLVALSSACVIRAVDSIPCRPQVGAYS